MPKTEHDVRQELPATPIPDTWALATLDEVGAWSGGGTPSKANTSFWLGGTIPWVSPKDMKSDYISSAIDSITPAAVENSSTTLIPAGSLLFVTRSGILRHTLPVAANTVPVAINQDLKALTPAPGVDADFLRLQVKMLSQDILARTTKAGTTVESVDFRALRDTKIVLAPPDQQRLIVNRINELLGRVESVRAAMDQLPEIVRAYKTAVLRLAFSGALTADWREARNLNGSWREVTLGDIAEIQSGITLGKQRSSDVNLVTRPYLRVANVQRGYLDLSDIKYVSLTEVEASKLELEHGDILMNEGGDRDKLGRGWVWEAQIDGCVHQNHVFRLRLHDRSFPPKYVSLLTNEFGRDHFFDQAKQTTNLASISKSRLALFPISLPTAREADEIMSIVSEKFTEIDRCLPYANAVREKLATLEYSVLSRAFSGDLVEQRGGDVRAQDVLARIQLEKQNQAAATKPANTIKGSRTMTISERVIEKIQASPSEGLTFQELHAAVPSDYEVLKDCVFELLTAHSAIVAQRFDPSLNAMKLVKVAK